MLFTFLKSVFFVVLCFGEPFTSQTIKCISLKYESYLARLSLINLNSNELRHYTFMVTLGQLDEQRGSCNTLDDLSDRICVSKKEKM